MRNIKPELGHLDFEQGIVRLETGETRNKESRTVFLGTEVLEILISKKDAKDNPASSRTMFSRMWTERAELTVFLGRSRDQSEGIQHTVTSKGRAQQHRSAAGFDLPEGIEKITGPVTADTRRQLATTNDHRGHLEGIYCRQFRVEVYRPRFAGDETKIRGFRAVVRADKIGHAGVNPAAFTSKDTSKLLRQGLRNRQSL